MFQFSAAGNGSADVLIGYQDSAHCEVNVLRSSGRLDRFVVYGPAIWNDVGGAPPPQLGSYHYQADCSHSGVTVTVNGQAFVRDTALPAIGGPAIDSA